MPVSAYLYPWDVDGDPAAPDRIAGLGVTEVSLAAAYHAVRAVTPFHPGRRVVTRDAAVYYRPDPGRWRGARLRPADPGDGAAGSFERAADALRAAGLTVNAWVVVAHNGRLGAAHPECTVRNAYGDRYPWALCIASPDVAGYAATLSAEVAALDGAGGIELEACGWYGYDHGSAHDKTGGFPAGTSGWLLDACFCAACTRALRDAGVDPGELARRVRASLDAVYQGDGPARLTPPLAAGPGELTPPLAAGPGELAEPFAAVRAATAAAFLRRVLAAVRDAAPGADVFVHADPDPLAAGANPYYDPAVLLGRRHHRGVPRPSHARAGHRPAHEERRRLRPPDRGPPPRRRRARGDRRRSARQGPGGARRRRDRSAAVSRGAGVRVRPRRYAGGDQGFGRVIHVSPQIAMNTPPTSWGPVATGGFPPGWRGELAWRVLGGPASTGNNRRCHSGLAPGFLAVTAKAETAARAAAAPASSSAADKPMRTHRWSTAVWDARASR